MGFSVFLLLSELGVGGWVYKLGHERSKRMLGDDFLKPVKSRKGKRTVETYSK